ncbi:band 4.1-like protein 2 [Dinothrombium tinctorium]|uniref:Band 4.1-like protein 2 n=1 Tax=Dinothrombium tinctorium TaxID=1965070 RepID=A0A443R940_9ACAR|nr:band 4.1-like protein 2 [Dinothrombium tinctorium]
MERDINQKFKFIRNDTSKGQDLLDVVFKHLNLLESAYFGLRFINGSGQVCWLETNKKIIKQMKASLKLALSRRYLARG